MVERYAHAGATSPLVSFLMKESGLGESSQHQMGRTVLPRHLELRCIFGKGFAPLLSVMRNLRSERRRRPYNMSARSGGVVWSFLFLKPGFD